MAFINDGVIKAVEKINSDTNSMETEKDIICLVSNDDKKMIENEVKKLTYVSSCKINDKGLQIILESNSTSRLVKHLACNNFNIEEIYKERKGLEQRYMELVEGGIR